MAAAAGLGEGRGGAGGGSRRRWWRRSWRRGSGNDDSGEDERGGAGDVDEDEGTADLGQLLTYIGADPLAPVRGWNRR